MFHDPAECAKYGRKSGGPDRAKIFEISDLIAMPCSRHLDRTVVDP